MSVYYEIKEHLVITDAAEYDYEVALVHGQLCLLGAWILQDRAHVSKLEIVVDGAEYGFSGDLMTQDYHKALKAMMNANSLEIISNYGYSVSALEVDPGPFPMMNHMEEMAKENPEMLEGIFYCACNHADCSDIAGVLVAYGKKEGKLYDGVVPFAEVDSITEGQWYTPLTAVVCDFEDLEGKDIPAIESVCRELMRFSEADSLDVSDDFFSFCLNNFRIKNDGELKEFMSLYAKFIDLTDGECSLIGELVDISGADAQVLHFDVEANGEYTMKLASAGK